MKELGVGIVGFGFMGKTHTFAHQTIPLYYAPPAAQCRLRVICECSPDAGREAMGACGFERLATDPREVIEADDVDIVHVCTPNHLHAEVLEAAIAAGKHIYVDKPVTGSLEEAERIAALLPDYRGVAQVALQYRFYPATLKARALIDEGFLGPVTHFRAAYLHGGSVDPAKATNWKSTAVAGGGAIRDLGAHIIDLLWHLIGPFQDVRCVSRIWADRRPNLDRPGEMMDIDAEEAATMILRSEDGAFGTVDVSKIATGTEDELRFEIHGRHGAIRFNLMQPNYLEVFDGRLPDGDLGGSHGWQRIATVQRYPGGGKFPGPKFTIGWIRGHVHCLHSFLEAIATHRDAHPSLMEGIHLQRVLESVRESARTETTIPLPQRTMMETPRNEQ
jgi:levoglucosan dehydrogenase